MASLQLSSSFHGTSVLFSRSQTHRLNNIPYSFQITRSSSRHSHWKRHSPYAPISKRHISSLLISSLHMQTPQGEALVAMANERLPPVLISQVASQQLELLAAHAAAATSPARDQESILKRRIAEIQENEIAEALQDITLALVTLRLLDATLAVPDQTPRQLDDAAQGLQAIHPSLVQPLIDRHVAVVVNGKHGAHLACNAPQAALAVRVHKLEMGKMYAASVMHGYFLARVYQRFQLERVLHNQRPKEEEVSMEAYLHSLDQAQAFRHLNSVSSCSHTGLDVIERHCQALFGVPLLHASPILNIQLGSVRSLILQALAFGALLWDVENNFISFPLLKEAFYGSNVKN